MILYSAPKRDAVLGMGLRDRPKWVAPPTTRAPGGLWERPLPLLSHHHL